MLRGLIHFSHSALPIHSVNLLPILSAYWPESNNSPGGAPVRHYSRRLMHDADECSPPARWRRVEVIDLKLPQVEAIGLTVLSDGDSVLLDLPVDRFFEGRHRVED